MGVYVPSGPASSLTRTLFAAALIVASGLFGPANRGVVYSQSVAQLSASDVTAVLRASAEAIGDETAAIAVVDRQARILGVYARRLAGSDTPDIAVTAARTAALFSNNQAPLSSRTVRFLSGIHFPAGVRNTPKP